MLRLNKHYQRLKSWQILVYWSNIVMDRIFFCYVYCFIIKFNHPILANKYFDFIQFIWVKRQKKILAIHSFANKFCIGMDIFYSSFHSDHFIRVFGFWSTLMCEPNNKFNEWTDIKPNENYYSNTIFTNATSFVYYNKIKEIKFYVSLSTYYVLVSFIRFQTVAMYGTFICNSSAMRWWYMLCA